MPTAFANIRTDSPIATRGEVAGLLEIKPAKLSSWSATRAGRSPLVHTVQGFGRFTVPLVGIAEAASLEALREGGMSMPEVRRAADFIREEHRDEYALASPRFLTDGTDAFIQDDVGLMRLRDHQGAMQEVLDRHLRPLIIGADGFVEAFHVEQFTSSKVTIDPRFNAGRMSFVESRVPVFAVLGALQAGEHLDSVAIDYGVDRSLVAEVSKLRDWLAGVT